MFRAGKFNVHRPRRVFNLARQMSLAKRLLNANQTQISGSSFRERTPTPTAKFSPGSYPQKKSSSEEDQSQSNAQAQRWPRKIFSGIQPTGSLHLGNYLGAVRKWTNLQKSRDNISLCIVDMHSITMPHNPPTLRENIFTMAATLLACGVDPALSTLFVQSAVLEHCEFNWILNSLTTMPRLAQLPQFKEKSRTVRDVPLGLYVYPVLQAADIMLYKATHVPVGIDQLQHIQLAQHLTRCFNARYGEMFPVCDPMIEENDGSRILSLREPTKKMSKSDTNSRATINLSDSPELVREKIKKAVTDFTSDISYSPNIRPGVSNLVNIHAQVTGQTIEMVVEEARRLDTAQYKERVSEAVIEHLRPIRDQINQHLKDRSELVYMLEMGSEKARKVAQQTMEEVKQRLGLGTNIALPASVFVAPPLQEHSKLTASQRLAKGVLHPDANAHSMPHYEQRCEPGHGGVASGAVGNPTTGELSGGQCNAAPIRTIRRPIVPVQSMRVEKSYNRSLTRHVFKLDTYNVPKIGFHDVDMTSGRVDQRNHHNPVLGFASRPGSSTVNIAPSSYQYGNSNASALASVTSQVNAALKKQEIVSSLANSAYYKAAASSFNSSNPSVVNMAVNSRNKNSSTIPTAKGVSSSSTTTSTSNTTSSSTNSNNATSSITNSTAKDSRDADEEDVEQGSEPDQDDDDNSTALQLEGKIEKFN